MVPEVARRDGGLPLPGGAVLRHPLEADYSSGCPPPEAQAVPRQVQRHIHQAPRPLPCLVRMDGAGAQVGRPAVGDPPGPGGAGQIRQHPQDAHRQGAALLGLVGAGELHVNCGLICPEPRQAARHPMSARPEPPGPAGRSLPLPNAPGSASCPHETMRASCSFSYPRIPRCRGPHIGVPAWRQDSTLTPCVTGMPAAHRPFASAAGVSRNQGALPGAFQISQAPAGPPSIPCL